MSVDDQLFKEDGTLITKIDIRILIFARFVATHLFAKDEEENLDNALGRTYKFAAFVMLCSNIMFCIAGVDGLILLFYLPNSFIYWTSARGACCNGRGSTVNVEEKSFYLFCLILALPAFFMQFCGNELYSIKIFTLGKILFAVGFFTFEIAFGYVRRLNKKPPKKEKVKALKPKLAFNPS